jgi:hypothetical protein
MTGISTKQFWVKENPDASTCTGCQTMIVSAKYVLSVEIKAGTNTETIPTSTVLCQSCYDALKIKNA